MDEKNSSTTRPGSESGEADPSPGEGEPRNPFDNPYFFPVLLFGFSIWFAYDGWFNPKIEYVNFNRVGAPLLLAAALGWGLHARRQVRRERIAPREGSADGTPPAGG